MVLAVSKDLPFAHARFCTTEGIENVIPLSDFRCSDFDENYGVRTVSYTHLDVYKRQEEALKVLQDALAIDSKYAEAYRLMRIAQLQMKKKQEACQSFAKAKELGDPNVDGLIEKHCK